MESKLTLLYVVFVILLSFATTKKQKPETYKGMTTPDEMERHLETQVKQMEMKLDTIEKRNVILKKKCRKYVLNNAK